MPARFAFCLSAPSSLVDSGQSQATGTRLPLHVVFPPAGTHAHTHLSHLPQDGRRHRPAPAPAHHLRSFSPPLHPTPRPASADLLRSANPTRPPRARDPVPNAPSSRPSQHQE
ncbi:hypothetical protein VPH35_065555 [Triticum aestivum]